MHAANKTALTVLGIYYLRIFVYGTGARGQYTALGGFGGSDPNTLL